MPLEWQFEAGNLIHEVESWCSIEMWGRLQGPMARRFCLGPGHSPEGSVPFSSVPFRKKGTER